MQPADEHDGFNASFVRALFSKMLDYLATQKFTDVNVTCKNKVFKCHRIILAAASEYFDRIFDEEVASGSLTEDINLDDIDVVAFEAVLRFFYRGGIVDIDDGNVYSLLRASDILQLKSIEDRCVRYLIERNIPANDALQLFLYACRKKKSSLIPTLSRFILDDLSRFSSDSDFLNMTLDEMTTLVTHSRPSSVKKENLVLNTIFKWICQSTDDREKRKLLFDTLSPNIQCQHITAEDVVGYFDKRMTNEEVCCDIDMSVASSTDFSLHIFVNSHVKRYPGQEMRPVNTPRSNLFTLEKSNECIDWSLSCVVEPTIEVMRTVVLDDRLYSLALQQNQFAFNVRSSIALSTGLQSLTPPFNANNINSYCICCDENNRSIYACNSDYRSNARGSLFIYNCDRDQWSPVPVVDIECKPALVTYHDNRLYLIGNKGSSEVRVYDHRAGRIEKLANSIQFHGAKDDCCSHKEKIYVSQTSDIYCDIDCVEPAIMMEVYDPVAAKWRVIEWKPPDMPNLHGLMPYEDVHRLISFDNRLWMFHSHGSPENEFSFVRVYDSYREEWTSSNALERAIWNLVHPVHDLHEDARINYSVRDVVAFKPL